MEDLFAKGGPTDSTSDVDLSVCFKAPINDIAVDAVGAFAVLGGKKTLYIVNLDEPWEPVKTLPQQSRWEVGLVLWNPHQSHASYFASTANTNTLIWNLDDRRFALQATFKSHDRPVLDLSWNFHDPNLLATCSADSNVHLWDTRIPKKAHRVQSLRPRAGVTQVKWNRNSTHVLATASDNEVRIWDVRKERAPLNFITAHMSKIKCLDWSYIHENHLLTASQDLQVKVWDTSSPRQPIHTIRVTTPVTRARFAPFGDGIVTTAIRDDHALNMWSLANAEIVHSFAGHNDVVTAFDWRIVGPPEDRNFQLVSWSNDQNMKLWKVDEADITACTFEAKKQGIPIPSPSPSRASPGLLHTIGSKSPSPRSEALRRSQMRCWAGLAHEFATVQKSPIEHVTLENINVRDSMCEAIVTVNNYVQQVRITFPSAYPHSAPPSFHLYPSLSIPHRVRAKLKEEVSRTAEFYVNLSKPCLEECLYQLVHTMQRELDLQSSNKSQDSMQESPFISSSVPSSLRTRSFSPSSLQLSPSFSPNTQEMIITAQENAMPCPRLCGAVFGNDTLISFSASHLLFSPLVKTNSALRLTPRNLNGYKHLANDSNSASDFDEDDEEESSSSAASSPSVATLSTSNPSSSSMVSATSSALTSALTASLSSSSFSSSSSSTTTAPRTYADLKKRLEVLRSRDMENKRKDKEENGLVEITKLYFYEEVVDLLPIKMDLRNKNPNPASLDMPRLNTIRVHRISQFLPISETLGGLYTLSGSSAPSICSRNARAAKKVGREDLVQLWSLIGHMMHPKLFPRTMKALPPFSTKSRAVLALNAMMGGASSSCVEDPADVLSETDPWSHHPFARPLLDSFFRHYERMGDIQTLALMSCILSFSSSNYYLTAKDKKLMQWQHQQQLQHQQWQLQQQQLQDSSLSSSKRTSSIKRLPMAIGNSGLQMMNHLTGSSIGVMDSSASASNVVASNTAIAALDENNIKKSKEKEKEKEKESRKSSLRSLLDRGNRLTSTQSKHPSPSTSTSNSANNVSLMQNVNGNTNVGATFTLFPPLSSPPRTTPILSPRYNNNSSTHPQEHGYVNNRHNHSRSASLSSSPPPRIISQNRLMTSSATATTTRQHQHYPNHHIGSANTQEAGSYLLSSSPSELEGLSPPPPSSTSLSSASSSLASSPSAVASASSIPSSTYHRTVSPSFDDAVVLGDHSVAEGSRMRRAMSQSQLYPLEDQYLGQSATFGRSPTPSASLTIPSSSASASSSSARDLRKSTEGVSLHQQQHHQHLHSSEGGGGQSWKAHHLRRASLPAAAVAAVIGERGGGALDGEHRRGSYSYSSQHHAVELNHQTSPLSYTYKEDNISLLDPTKTPIYNHYRYYLLCFAPPWCLYLFILL
ncbi:GATOR complex protein wdr59, variant 2 [Balamuthia mandrillaris]